MTKIYVHRFFIFVYLFAFITLDSKELSVSKWCERWTKSTTSQMFNRQFFTIFQFGTLYECTLANACKHLVYLWFVCLCVCVCAVSLTVYRWRWAAGWLLPQTPPLWSWRPLCAGHWFPPPCPPTSLFLHLCDKNLCYYSIYKLSTWENTTDLFWLKIKMQFSSKT